MSHTMNPLAKGYICPRPLKTTSRTLHKVSKNSGSKHPPTSDAPTDPVNFSFFDLGTYSTVTVAGTAWRHESYVSIEYPWLAVPAFLWLLTAVCWLSTVWMTRKSGAPVWKSSLLAALESRRRGNLGTTTHNIHTAAEQRYAQLHQDEVSWTLEYEEPMTKIPVWPVEDQSYRPRPDRPKIRRGTDQFLYRNGKRIEKISKASHV